ncbi:MAG: diadenylate cyclase CdaA [Thermodesulfobacteriota bacterium]
MQAVQEFFRSVTWVNLLDIIILSCLIYYPLTWFAWTRAVQILVTLMVIGLAYFGAIRAGLILTSYLFQYLWAALIVLLVIVFRPEIREMFDRAAPIRLLTGRRRTESDSSQVEEMARAVMELARTRLGALIVCQRLDGLVNLALRGIKLDAIVSAETLLTIFQKQSPLHDGAVIIKGDRIVEASSILPLSRDEGLSSKYGTRHRAALGISERSDALVVVVSEERGEVSLVEQGRIVLVKSQSDLIKALEDGLTQRPAVLSSSSRGISGFFLGNLHVKGLSFATAIVLWFAVVGPRWAEVGMSVPIQYANLPADMEITGQWVDKVDVRVKGSESALANLQPGSVRAVIDLTHLVPGLNYVRISNRNLLVPPGISIKQIRPSDLHLKIEANKTETFLVKASLVGEPLVPRQISVTPNAVKIRGLKGELKKVESVITDPVDGTTLLQKGKIVVPVRVRPEGLRIETIRPSEVTVSVGSSIE